MQDAAPDTFEHYNALLNELLSGENGASSHLPRLLREKGPFEEFFEKIKAWFDHKANFNVPSGAWDLSAFFLLLKWLVIVLAAVLVVGAIYRLVRRTRKKTAAVFSPQRRSIQAATLQNLESLMADKIRSALDQKAFDRAGRLRWKLFLKRLNRDPSLTPWEFEADPVRRKIIESQYQLMFGKQPKIVEHYRLLDRSLLLIERRHPSHAA